MPEGREPAGGALILAAGASRRFGSDKRHYELEPDRPMLLETISRYRTTYPRITVVLRPDDDVVAQLIADRFTTTRPDILFAPSAHLGMGHSLADAVRVLSDWDYLFVGLGDMPFVTAATLGRLDARMRTLRARGADAIVRPRSGGAAGHPVGFTPEFYTELRQLSGDTGARDVLRRHCTRIVLVDVDDAGIHRDVDRPLRDGS